MMYRSQTKAYCALMKMTKVETNNGVSSLKICHPAEAFAHNIRGYISTILPSLQCRMDVQCSDGHCMLLNI